MSSVSISLITDDIVEGDESFNIMLNISSLVVRGINAGVRNSAKMTITDSTGKYHQQVVGVVIVFTYF